MTTKRYSIFALSAAVLFLCLFGFVEAQNAPTAPASLSYESHSTFDDSNYAAQTFVALAGNITQLTLTAIGQTQAWQGYWGNISGSITLDDANNFTFYNWTAAEPQGEIYATLGNSVAWESVDCYQFDNAAMNVSTMESYYGIADNHVDGIDETYNSTDHPSFEVVFNTVTSCPTTYIFQNDQHQTENFVNVLLWDLEDNTTGWIYATVIENKTENSTNDLVCFNGESCDFQLLVNEDGHGADTTATTYYFWVELN